MSQDTIQKGDWRMHETAEDRSNEERLIRLVSAMPHKMSRWQVLDFFVAGPPPSVWEVKHRDQVHDTWIVSIRKVFRANDFEACGVAAYALVEVCDPDTGECIIYRMRFKDVAPARIDWGGGRNRGDANDQEPVVYYNYSDMEIINGTISNTRTPDRADRGEDHGVRPPASAIGVEEQSRF